MARFRAFASRIPTSSRPITSLDTIRRPGRILSCFTRDFLHHWLFCYASFETKLFCGSKIIHNKGQISTWKRRNIVGYPEEDCFDIYLTLKFLRRKKQRQNFINRRLLIQLLHSRVFSREDVSIYVHVSTRGKLIFLTSWTIVYSGVMVFIKKLISLE